MTSTRLSIPTAELGRRMRDRLRGGGSITAPKVVWSQHGQQLLVHADTLASKFVDGWLVVNLEVETDQTKRTTLQFVYFLGRSGDGDSVGAGGSINAPTPQSAQIAAVWGADLQRVLWDAVLDAVEACLQRASTAQRSGKPLTLQGFHANAEAFFVEVLAGEI